MGKEDKDQPLSGLAVHLDGLRLDKEVEEIVRARLAKRAPEQLTNPGIPRAKAGRCMHGLRKEECEECRTPAVPAASSEAAEPEPPEPDKEDK